MALVPRRVVNTKGPARRVSRSIAARSAQTVQSPAEQKRWQAAEEDKGDLALLQRVLSAKKISDLDPGDREKVNKLTSEAIAPQLFTMTAGDGEDPGFRRITSIATLRDLNPLMHDRMLQVCYFLRVTTPFGKRIVEIFTEYTLGKGVRVTAKDPNVQKVIDSFWTDKVNKMDDELEQWMDELTTFGELCVPVAVNEVSGRVRKGYIDPMNIDTVQFAELATADGTTAINVPYAVRLRRQVGEVLEKPMLLVREIEDPNDPNFGELDGDGFYWTINKAKSASRGFSELFNLADWIDLFDQMIFDFGDKVRFLNSFVWHYIFKGADEKKVQEYKDKLTKDPPRQGSVLVTNEQIEVQAQTPDFKGADMAEGAQMVKKYGWAGAGIPLVLTGDGDDANRAAALEMNAPFTKKIQRKQNHLSRCIIELLDFVIACAVRAGVLGDTVDRTYTVEFPEVAVKDLQRGAQTLQGASAALQTGQAEGWITGQTAARAFHTILGEIGVDIGDSQHEYEAAQQELEDRAARQQNSMFPQQQLADALKQMQNPQQQPTDPDEEEES